MAGDSAQHVVVGLQYLTRWSRGARRPPWRHELHGYRGRGDAAADAILRDHLRAVDTEFTEEPRTKQTGYSLEYVVSEWLGRNWPRHGRQDDAITLRQMPKHLTNVRHEDSPIALIGHEPDVE
jgi:hypothetical protein